MRVAAYQFTTSGEFADRALRICVFQASRSTMVRSTDRFGCIASKSAASFSMTARGAGFDMSDVIRNVPDRSAAIAEPAMPATNAAVVIVVFKKFDILTLPSLCQFSFT